MTIEVPPPVVDRWLDRIEDLGYRSLRAFAPWLLFVSSVRFFVEPSWLPAEFGLGGLLASAADYWLRWKYPLPKHEAPADTS